MNPAAAVRGPKHVVTKGATPVLTPAETRSLLDGIDPGTLVGLRDRALLSVMVYGFARVSAVVGVRTISCRGRAGGCGCTRKGGKRHDVPYLRRRTGVGRTGSGVPAPRERTRPGVFDCGLPGGRVPSMRIGAADVVSDGAGGALRGSGCRRSMNGLPEPRDESRVAFNGRDTALLTMHRSAVCRSRAGSVPACRTLPRTSPR